jgi:hypothetical protein
MISLMNFTTLAAVIEVIDFTLIHFVNLSTTTKMCVNPPLTFLNGPTMLVTFGDVSNYCTKTLVVEVVDFSRPYQVFLGWSCYVKFMAIPSYA